MRDRSEWTFGSAGVATALRIGSVADLFASGAFAWTRSPPPAPALGPDEAPDADRDAATPSDSHAVGFPRRCWSGAGRAASGGSAAAAGARTCGAGARRRAIGCA
ncbi:hypothetical protein UK82_29595 [Frankia sp. ACN1ag]|nr:hypothetical protein UK82_29595 [Frankia sp. ACN1ag]